ncbi:fibrobacter succinogenes major paralogous domain-containing protein [bacterium]|nr:fibrobacter succinogenes major paralogous domain-containing protein [bacterium]
MKIILLLIVLTLAGCLGGGVGAPRGSLDSISNQTTNEATAKFVTLSGRSQISSDILTYHGSSSNSDVVVTVSGHTLTLTPNSDWNGTATITATMYCRVSGASDNSCSPQQTFTLTVNEFTSGSTFKGKIYQTVTSPDTGRVWLDRNLGATQVCTSSTDTACYGYYYAWGRNDDGHELATSSTTTTLATSISPATGTYIKDGSCINQRPCGNWVDWTRADINGLLRAAAWANAGVNDICPAGFVVPTEAELKADTIDATTTDITNATTAFSSFLKFPVGGYRNGASNSPTYGDVGSGGYAWTRTVGGSGSGSGDSSFFVWNNGPVAIFIKSSRSYGLSVRCIKEL